MPRRNWTGSAEATSAPFTNTVPLLGVTRHDHNASANLSALYLISANWSVRAEYQYARNSSNLELYDYTRHVGALKLRYEFK